MNSGSPASPKNSNHPWACSVLIHAVMIEREKSATSSKRQRERDVLSSCCCRIWLNGQSPTLTLLKHAKPSICFYRCHGETVWLESLYSILRAGRCTACRIINVAPCLFKMHNVTDTPSSLQTYSIRIITTVIVTIIFSSFWDASERQWRGGESWAAAFFVIVLFNEIYSISTQIKLSVTLQLPGEEESLNLLSAVFKLSQTWQP